MAMEPVVICNLTGTALRLYPRMITNTGTAYNTEYFLGGCASDSLFQRSITVLTLIIESSQEWGAWLKGWLNIGTTQL